MKKNRENSGGGTPRVACFEVRAVHSQANKQRAPSTALVESGVIFPCITGGSPWNLDHVPPFFFPWHQSFFKSQIFRHTPLAFESAALSWASGPISARRIPRPLEEDQQRGR